MSNRDPLDQLASLRIQADASTRSRHLQAIRAELQRRPKGPASARRRWTLGVVVALIAAGPAAAIAADDALPGDVLYPIKRVAEPIIQLFDRDVAAEHRIEEVAGLMDQETDDAVIRQRIDVARDALTETDSPILERELDRIVDRWISDRAEPPAGRSSTTSEPVRVAPTNDRSDRMPEPAPQDAPESTTTTSAPPPVSEPPPSDRTTTTVQRDGGDRPPADGRTRDTP